MTKTVQVRIPADLATDAGICSKAFGETFPEYIARLVREGLKRDFPKAAKIIARRAEQAGKADETDAS